MGIYARQTGIIVAVSLLAGFTGGAVFFKTFALTSERVIYHCHGPADMTGPGGLVEVTGPGHSLATPTVEALTRTDTNVTIRVRGLSGNTNGAWVGLIPSGTPHGDETINDSADVAWTWVTPQQENYKLTIPSQASQGEWDLRLHPCWPGCREVASVPLPNNVRQLPSTPTISVVGQVGNSINFDVQGLSANNSGAWVALVPADVPHGSETVNNQNALNWTWVSTSQRRYSLVIPANRTTSALDLRLHRCWPGCREASSTSFTAVTTHTTLAGDYNATLTIKKHSGEITILVQADKPLPNTAWVGVIPSSVSHGSEQVNDQHDISYVYVSHATSAEVTLPSPPRGQRYSLRLNESDSGGRELASIELPTY